MHPLGPLPGDRVQVEGVAVQLWRSDRIAIASEQHFSEPSGSTVPPHSGQEPWLVHIVGPQQPKHGERGLFMGSWLGSAVQLDSFCPADAATLGGANNREPALGPEPPEASAFFPPTPIGSTEERLMAAGLIIGRAEMRGGKIRYAVDDVPAMKPLLWGLHDDVEVVQCIASPRDRDLIASIDATATRVNVLCAVGSGMNTQEPAQPLYYFEMAWIPPDVADMVRHLSSEIITIETHLALVNE